MLDISIGRESQTNKLVISSGNYSTIIGSSNSVPKSVSRNHCVLTICDDTGLMEIANSNINNKTFVNGVQIEKRKIRPTDIIELSDLRFRLQWDDLMKAIKEIESKMPKELDISYLENVWKEYKRKSDSLQRAQTLTNVLKGGIPILTIGGATAPYLLNKNITDNSQIKFFSIVAIVLLVILFIKSLIDTRRIPMKKEELNKQLLHDYSCPNCHFFFGYQAYDIIKTNLDACPKCKATFKKINTI